MDPYIVVLVCFGFIVLLTAWLPLVLARLPLSLPIFCILFGMVFVWAPITTLPVINPLENRFLTEKITEFVVIVALMGAGLKLDRPIGWRRWNITWRLLGIAMPLTILMIALLGYSVLNLGIASALLLGACLAPTDPVLASDVQVGPPQSGEEDEVRFALTSEAGLNDGLSFPFIYLAIALAMEGSDKQVFSDWLIIDVIWRLFAGIGIGWLTGKLLGIVTFRLPKRAQLSQTGDGFVALGITCLCYGLTELIHGYGFIAVFVAALSLRSVERQNKYHESLHDFAEQIERLLMMVLMVCFGAVIAEGALFRALDWQTVLTALCIVFLVRPLSAWIGMLGLSMPKGEKAVIAFFGIRGLGSFYYLSFAAGHADFENVNAVWITMFFVVLISIIIHGISVTPAMRYLDKSANRLKE